MARRVQVAEQADAASSDKERLSSSPRGQASVRKHASAQPLHLSQELEAATFPLTKSTSRDEKRRAAIFSGLLLANEDAWASLLQVTDVESAQIVASSLVRLFAAEGQDLKLVKYCIMKDVADTQEEALLLRGSGIYPAIVAYAGLYHGRTYLQTVIAPVLHIVLSRPSSSFEIDPRRAGSEEAAKKNAENLVNAANHVIAALLSNIEEMPIALRRTFEFAQRCVSGKFPAHGIRLVTNLFFLRLLCPALVAPEEYGLCKSRPSDTTMRAHILLAKLLQSVANEVPPFGKEEYMQPLNRWVEAAVPSVRRFFKIALNIVHTDKLDVPSVLCKLHAIPNATETADGKYLFQFARSNCVAYREHLTAAKAKEALEILREILPEEEIANRSPPRAHRVGSDYGSDGSSPRSSDSRLKQ